MVNHVKHVGSLRYAAPDYPVRGGRLRVGMGDARVDLSGMRVPEGTHVLRVHVGMGDLHLTRPTSLPTRIEADVGMGDIRVGAQTDSGIGNRVEWEDPGYAKAVSRLLIVASVSMGDIKIP